MLRVIKYFIVLQLAALACSYSDDDNDDGRIIGGEDAKVGEFPYQVSIRFSYIDEKGNNRTGDYCGGSIIADQWILTAGHCVDSGNDVTGWTILAGTNLLSQGGDVYKVEKFVLHEKYGQPARDHNDIGLVKVTNKIRLNHLVKKIRLAETDTPEGVEAVLSGWGIISYPHEKYPDKLQKIKLHTISNKICGKELDTDKLEIYPENICTFEKTGKGACFGDSGSPLVVGGKQIGIVSWGRPCARGKPDVYTRVYKYLNWINDNIKNG